MKNEKGFTLVEMMIVLLVITVLLIITIPNIARHNSTIHEKGCEALKKMVAAQVQAFEMDNNRAPASINELTAAGYLTEGQTTCPNGESIELGSNGEVR
mgnify:CR=1 FL=1